MPYMEAVITYFSAFLTPTHYTLNHAFLVKITLTYSYNYAILLHNVAHTIMLPAMCN